MDTAFAEVNGARLRYSLQGEGQPMVMIHSVLARLEMWDEQVSAFSNRFRMIRYDTRGYGWSTGPEGNYADYEDLAALLDHLRVDRAVLMGSSSGGGIAIDFALAFPARVQALVLAGSALSGTAPDPDPAIDPTRAAIAAAYERGDIAQAAELTAQIWVDGPRRTPQSVSHAYRSRALEMICFTLGLPDRADPRQLEPPAAGRLGEIQAPALVVLGGEDTAWMHRVSGRLAAEIPHARFALLPGTAHFPNMEKPAEFNRAVGEFLDQIGT